MTSTPSPDPFLVKKRKRKLVRAIEADVQYRKLNLVQVLVGLDEEAVDIVTRLCYELKISRAALIRIAVREYAKQVGVLLRETQRSPG